MEILDKTTDKNCSWFCYNSDDVAKWIALASGNLKVGDSFSYEPPTNKTHLYFVRFTDTGGGTELAGGITKRSGQSITLLGSDGQYHAVVKDD